MTRARLLIFVLLAAAAGCLAIVLNGEYTSGNVYADYSSQRTDRMGAAALYDALSKVYPEVSRNEVPLPALTLKDSELLILGLPVYELNAGEIDVLESLAKAGNRVVIALDGAYLFNLDQTNESLEAKWHVAIRDHRRIEAMADSDLRPRQKYDFMLPDHSEWKRAGDAGIARNFGRGSVLLLGTSWPFSNGALRDERDTAALDLAIGNPRRIVFDETHLGTEERGSVMGIARQFRLQGVIAVALVCALLFIWQSSAPFPPERASAAGSDTRLVAASAGEGLRNLLTHHIPANRVMSACVDEWRKDRGRLVPADTLAQIESIAAGRAHPVSQWRAIRAALGLGPDTKRKK